MPWFDHSRHRAATVCVAAVLLLAGASCGDDGEASPASTTAATSAPATDPIPRWVRLLHRALSGAVTVDNLDYVRRDARMWTSKVTSAPSPEVTSASRGTQAGSSLGGVW